MVVVVVVVVAMVVVVVVIIIMITIKKNYQCYKIRIHILYRVLSG